MGWIAYTRDGQKLQEDVDGRPVQAGDEGKLLLITQEDFGHKVAVDLISGVILIDYESLEPSGEGFNIESPKTVLWICDETTIVGELLDRETTFEERTEEDGSIQGYDTYVYKPLIWRPIWFTRVIGGIPTKIVGAQTTTPEEMFGAKNVKKMVMLFADGRIGIY